MAPLMLNAVALHTQDGSLSLQGELTLAEGALLDSTSGTLTLEGTVDNLSKLALPSTTLTLQDDLEVFGTITTGAGTDLQNNGFVLDLSGGTLELGGDLSLSGTVTDNATRLRLLTDAALESQETTNLGELNLNGFALTVSIPTLNIFEPLALETAGEQLVAGSSNLHLRETLRIESGELSSSGGTVTLDTSASLGDSGVLDLQGSVLELSGSLNVDNGTLNAVTATVRLLDNITFSSNNALSLGTLEMSGNALSLGSSSTDLSIENSLSLDNGTALNTGAADLTLVAPANVRGALQSSGGTLTFREGGAIAGVLNADNSSLALTTENLAVTGLLQTNGGTTLTGADFLNLSGGTLEVAEGLTLDGVTTDKQTTLRLSADTTLVRDSPFTVGRVELDNHTLTLGS
ncbi:MAG: hypothetical protein QF922_11690, partial [SAR324 cluster bacterium]|nr:hypothetical protein [SAR324 cluster bacterium]